MNTKRLKKRDYDNMLTEELESEIRKVRESQQFLRHLVYAIVKRYGDEHGFLRLDNDWDAPLPAEPVILTNTDTATMETLVRARL